VKRSDYIALRCLVYHFARAHLRECGANAETSQFAWSNGVGTQFSPAKFRWKSVRGENKLALTCKLRFIAGKYDETGEDDGGGVFFPPSTPPFSY